MNRVLPRPPQGLLPHLGHAVRLPQAGAPDVSRGRGDLRQRGEGQGRAGAVARPGVQYKTAFVLAHKIREAMAAESRGVVIGGAGRTAEIDGAHFGGHLRPENRKKNCKDRRLAINQTGQRQCVVTIRERDDRTVTGVFPSDDGACTNGAESFFSRIRRGEIGHHYHLSGLYLHRYANEAAFREDHRRTSNGEQFRAVVGLVTRTGPSVDFCGYWQRPHAA